MNKRFNQINKHYVIHSKLSDTRVFLGRNEHWAIEDSRGGHTQLQSPKGIPKLRVR